MKKRSDLPKDYFAIHKWLNRKYGSASMCENPECSGKSTRFDWALKKGEIYNRNRDCFIMLCRHCHIKYDSVALKSHTIETRKKISNTKRKLSLEDAVKIRELAVYLERKLVAQMYGVSTTTVCHIVKNYIYTT